jgi:uncharacterized protein (DUF362 family)
MSTNNHVYLVKIKENDIQDALSRLLGKLSLPQKANKIGIKLNLCDYRKRETGVTTDPLVLDPLLKLLRKSYPETYIYLFEHDATGTVADNLFEWLGLDKIAKKYNVDFLNLAREEWIPACIDGYCFKETEIPRILNESLIINHPKLKTHGRTKITCALKNMYACYRIKDKVRYHSFLDKAIADINIPIKSHFTIVDGLLCVEGNRGPTQGFPKNVGVFIGGEDIVSVDSFCAKLMGFNPYFVKHIRLAASKNIGSMKYQIESELNKREMRQLRFKFNLSKYYLMEILRKVVKN